VKYVYHDLSDSQFEHLTVLVCQRLFGLGVQGFATGPDSGRDAKFVGTAEVFPSEKSPWIGTTIIQAKHTNGYNKHFTETDFYSEGAKDTILAKEILRVKALRASKLIDNYVIFSNRRLSANGESDIRAHISKECEIPEQSIYLVGVQQLETWFKQPRFSDIPEIADLDPIDSPLIVSPDELAEVVEALARQKATVKQVLNVPPTSRTNYAAKNAINDMSQDYASAQLKQFLKYTEQIQEFLAAPENEDILQSYEAVVDEFNFNIIAKRKDYQAFDDVMNYLLRMLFERDAVLRQRQHKRLTRAVLFYMYWNCDIGKVIDASAH